MGRIAVTGSVANDTIMGFSGRFGDHILPEQTRHLSVSFQIDVMEQRRGGTAPNICHTLALLGERPLLCGAVGAADFDDYAASLESVGVDTSSTLRCQGVATGAAFITTDADSNQITSFFAGAMSRAIDVDLTQLDGVSEVVVAADNAAAMSLHCEQAGALGARLVFAPAQQIPAMTDAQLLAGLERAWVIVGNTYELRMIEERTGLGVAALRAGAIVAVTHGADGSELHDADELVRVPAATVSHLADPTGAGDAYLGGLVCGLRADEPLPVAGRMGAVAAAFCVERPGPQGQSFSWDSFVERYSQAFGEPLPRPPRAGA